VNFLFKALEEGSNCDISYKSSKNPRLHAELWLIKLCRIMAEPVEMVEKKKSEDERLSNPQNEIPVPSKSEIIREAVETKAKEYPRQDKVPPSHIPVFEKPSKSFSIKEVIADNKSTLPNQSTAVREPDARPISSYAEKIEFTGESFTAAWQEFVENMNGDGPRIISMFKSIQPEMEDEHTIRIHLNNAAQKDLFVQNYKPRLLNFLENKFKVSELDIETAVDLSESDELLYTDEQKYSYLQNKYPVLKDFKKSFNLDLT
jgi:DNA polymerase-3 subunit gamma/tau